jgi:hypothetical protein
MRFRTTLTALLVAAPSALAQDSVSKLNALPGDSLNAYDASEQINDYVVDQTAFTSSWGAVFGLAPIAKSSAQRVTAPLFYTGQISAQSLSRRLAVNVPFLRSQYALWTTPGAGANNDPARNDPGTLVSTAGLTGFQFGFGFAEFGDGNPAGTGLNNVIGGLVNFTAAQPSRLYVSRIAAALGGSNESCAVAAFGMGAVDEGGDLDLRADNNLTTNAGCPSLGLFTGNNLFRVRMAARGAALNVLSDSFPTAADAAATDRLLVNSTTTHGCPNLIPRSVAGRSILMVVTAPTTPPGSYVFEQSANVLTTSAPGAHLAGMADHRGSVGYATYNFPQLFPGSVSGTAGVLGKIGTPTDNLVLFGLDANGGFLAPIARALPATVSDNDQTWSNTLQPGTQQFDHYHGTALYRASPSQVALGQDQAGNLLAAAVVYYGTYTNLDPNCYIAVAKIDPTAGTTSWTTAAWTRNVATGYGKNIYQNGSTVIGTLKPFGVPGTGTGPTMSAPMIDSVGNVWFVGAFELAAAPGTTQVGLLRAVYQPATFSYKLELVLKQGDVFAGRNSGRNYKIAFIPLNYSATVSPSAPWSGNIAEVASGAQSVAGLATSDAATLGGLVMQANVVYDNNGDGQFVPSTGTGGTPGSPDEDYNVLLYVAASRDCNANGIPDDREIADGTVADSNNNGVPDSCEGIAGLLFCFGDGSGTACPCGNNSAAGSQDGCLSSLGTGGRLRASGNASLAADTIVLTGAQMPNSSALYFQGTNQQNGGLGAAFGDGLRCAGGTVIRLGTKANVAGASQYPAAGDPPTSVRGLVTAPGTRTYQIWYRNAAAFCTAATFNLSNGCQITWAP